MGRMAVCCGIDHPRAYARLARLGTRPLIVPVASIALALRA